MYKKNKILFISHVLDYSGAPRSLYYLLKYFPQKNRYEFWVLGLRNSALLQSFKRVADKVEVITPYPSQALFRKALERISSLPKIYNFLKKARPQLVIINSAANSRAIILSRILGYRTWVYVHEFDAGFVLFPKLRRKAILLADKIIVTNRLQQKWIQEDIGYQGSVKIIPNMLPPLSKKNLSVERDFEIFTRKHTFLVATVGYFTRLKGWDLLLDIMELLKDKLDIGFVLVGDFPRKEERRKFKKELVKRDLSERVYITGLVSDIWPYIERVQCIAITSRSETFSRAAMEAMAYGIPVVAFNVGSLSEVFPTDYPYLIAPFNKDLFAKKLIEIKNLRPNQKKEIQQVFEQHIKKFSPEQIVPLFVGEIEKFFAKFS